MTPIVDTYRPKVKICGVTNLNDALIAAYAGADAIGFIFAESRRQVEPKVVREIIQQLPPFINTVGVFMDQAAPDVMEIAHFTGIGIIQLHGDESPEYCQLLKRRIIKRFKVTVDDTQESLIEKMKPYRVSAYLLDPGAGEGVTFNWDIARDISYPLIIAGGLTPLNVREVVDTLRPYGVDVSSGVENPPGIKDPQKVHDFIIGATRDQMRHHRIPIGRHPVPGDA